MKRFIISVFALIVLAGSAFAGEVTLEWDYPEELNAVISGFRIYHNEKSMSGPKDKDGVSPLDPSTRMIQVDDALARSYQLELPAGTSYVRMSAIRTESDKVVESVFSKQIKIKVKPAPVMADTPPSDLKVD